MPKRILSQQKLESDEIYEHLVYEGEHIPLCAIEGMRDRTITISGASKTFSVTGWRVGWIIAPPDVTGAIRKVHDFLTVGPPAPLQDACAAALEQLGPDYYGELLRGYAERRNVLYGGLMRAGFKCSRPAGSYYILADFSRVSDEDADAFARRLTRGTEGKQGVASVPGSSFFHEPRAGRQLVRFAFCKRLPTLEAAADALHALVT